jgi:hypothetical protein
MDIERKKLLDFFPCSVPYRSSITITWLCSYHPQPLDCAVRLPRIPFLAIVDRCGLDFSILSPEVAPTQPTTFNVKNRFPTEKRQRKKLEMSVVFRLFVGNKNFERIQNKNRTRRPIEHPSSLDCQYRKAEQVSSPDSTDVP